MPSDPPLFRRSPLTQNQQCLVSNFTSEILSHEVALGPFRAGNVNTEALAEILGNPPFVEEAQICLEAVAEALAHNPPWLNGPPPPSDVFNFRTPELFTAEEAEAIDKDVMEGIENGTYQEVQAAQVATCLTRRPVRQQEKFRIIDNARPLNNYMDPEKCSVAYEDLRWARAVAGPFMSKIDLKKGYRQLRLDKSAKPFFSFVWRGKLYSFNVMAFGDASAPKAFTKFMRAFALRWRKLGIVCIIYLDDILISAHTFDKWLRSTRAVISDLNTAGVRIGVDKLFLGPFECIEFLGVFLDFPNSCLFIGEERLHKLSTSCTDLLKHEGSVCVKDVQALLGLLSFFSVAYPGLSLWRRALDLWVAAAGDVMDLPLTPEARSELRFWEDALPHWKKRPLHSFPFFDGTLVTDASESAWAGILVRQSQICLAAWNTFPSEICGTASITRELFGLLSFFKTCVSEGLIPPQHRIQVQIDNMGAGCLMRKVKAKTPDTLAIMREFFELQDRSESQLIVDWRERSDPLISLVDRLSKMAPPGTALKTIVRSAILVPQGPPRKELGTAEWALQRKLFVQLCAWAWGPDVFPEVDLFATEANSQMPSFCSRYYSPKSLGNAFSFPWSGKRLYAFPPFSQLPDCLEKIRQSSSFSLLLVTKFDRSAPFWPLLLALRPKRSQEVRKENVVLTSDGTAKGHPPFDLAVFVFE